MKGLTLNPPNTRLRLARRPPPPLCTCATTTTPTPPFASSPSCRRPGSRARCRSRPPTPLLSTSSEVKSQLCESPPSPLSARKLGQPPFTSCPSLPPARELALRRPHPPLVAVDRESVSKSEHARVGRRLREGWPRHDDT